MALVQPTTLVAFSRVYGGVLSFTHSAAAVVCSYHLRIADWTSFRSHPFILPPSSWDLHDGSNLQYSRLVRGIVPVLYFDPLSPASGSPSRHVIQRSWFHEHLLESYSCILVSQITGSSTAGTCLPVIDASFQPLSGSQVGHAMMH